MYFAIFSAKKTSPVPLNKTGFFAYDIDKYGAGLYIAILSPFYRAALLLITFVRLVRE